MSLVSWIKIMSSATAMSLIYIHMQMQIVDLAYKGKAKEHQVRELVENNSALNHQILSLKSASYLGQAILEKNENMQFMGHDRVMTYPVPPAGLPNRSLQRPPVKPEKPMWNWLSFLSPQDAKAWDH